MSDKFQIAHQRARRMSGEKWFLLSDDEQAQAVAFELRAIGSQGHLEVAEVVNDH
jgi:hypothetical protein